MLGLLDYWRQEAQGPYRQVREGEDVSDAEIYKSRGPSSLESIVQTVYQIAPFLLLLNLGFAATWTAQGLSHTLKRSRTFAPDLSISTMLFEENAIFTAPASPESDAAWEAIRPKGGGAIAVPNAKAYGLEPGIPMKTGPDVYGVSMFHQLHCLVWNSPSILRTSYYAALNGSIPAFKNPEVDLLPQEKQVMLQHGHVAHCFDYVRQGIMCAGDLTIESAKEFPEKWLEGISEDLIREKYGDQKPVLVDGWGIKHQCRSYDKAKDWAFRNRVPDDAGVSL